MLIVKDVFTRNVITVGLDATVREVCGIMASKRIGSVFVTDVDGNVVGIVTESDVIRKVVGDDKVPYVTSVADIMSGPLVTIDLGETIYQAQEMMDQRRILHLGVTDEGKIIGMCSIRDLIHPYEHFERGASWV